MSRRWMSIVPVAAAFGVGVLVAAMAAGQPAGGGVKNQGEPGAQHAELAKLAGEYTTAAKLTLSEGSDAFESEGTAKVSVIVDGRFIQIDETGETLGVPFKSQKIWGYNGGVGRYESVWLYSGATAMTTLAGKSTDGGKTIRLEGSFEDPDGKSKYAVDFVIVDSKTFKIVQAALNPDGSSGAKVETVYTRK